jgi:hypothetical protein
MVGLVVIDEATGIGLEVELTAEADADGREVDERRAAEGLVDAIAERTLLARAHVEIVFLIFRERKLGGLDE